MYLAEGNEVRAVVQAFRECKSDNNNAVIAICPFCGMNNRAVKWQLNTGVECDNCPAELTQLYGRRTFDTNADARKFINKQTNDNNRFAS